MRSAVISNLHHWTGDLLILGLILWILASLRNTKQKEPMELAAINDFFTMDGLAINVFWPLSYRSIVVPLLKEIMTSWFKESLNILSGCNDKIKPKQLFHTAKNIFLINEDRANDKLISTVNAMFIFRCYGYTFQNIVIFTSKYLTSGMRYVINVKLLT